MADTNLRGILQQLEAEKNIDRDTLVEAIRVAIESAARKSMSHADDVVVEVDEANLEFRVFEIRKVVETVTDPAAEMSLEDALELNPEAHIGNRLKVETEPKDFGRIAAQTAKQVIIQKIKDAVRDNVYDEYKKREGELLTGTVKRSSHGNVVVMIDKTEAIIPQREQSPRENFRPGERVRALLVSVEKTPRGAQVILSRTSSDLVRALFEMEVPEIYDSTIEIKAIAREPGNRTKVAVVSHDPNVDAVGACVGMKGSRVRTVVEELSGEKIDIVRWNDDPLELCRQALNPADIIALHLDEDSKTVLVTVPHDQLSLAIGKKGQNARLASKLIGWNIDIRSDTEMSGDEDVSEKEGDEATTPVESGGAEHAVENAEASTDADESVAQTSEPDAQASDSDAQTSEPELVENMESETTD